MDARERKAAELGAAVLCAVVDMGEAGAPEGPMYAALMQHAGMGLAVFNALLGGMERAGMIVREVGHVVRATEKGREYARKLEGALAGK